MRYKLIILVGRLLVRPLYDFTGWIVRLFVRSLEKCYKS